MISAPKIPISQAAIAEFCRRHHVRRLSLFGSVLREDFGPASDVDVLVEFEPEAGVGFFGLAEMEEEFGRIVHRKADLVTEGFLGRSKGRVLAEAVKLYEL